MVSAVFSGCLVYGSVTFRSVNNILPCWGVLHYLSPGNTYKSHIIIEKMPYLNPFLGLGNGREMGG